MDLKIFTRNIEEKANEQVMSLVQQDAFKESKIRIMPDVHAGKGCVIGFTGNLGDKVIPNIVGVDIGCGMLCVNLGKVDIDFQRLDEVIRCNVPCGMNVHEHSYFFNSSPFIEKLVCSNQLKNIDNWLFKSMGTLGGGNHFIEVDGDDDGNKYLIIHSGSRNIGKQVAEIYQQKAIKNCSYEDESNLKIKESIISLKKSSRQSEIEKNIKSIKDEYKGKLKLPKDLCYLEGKDRDDYIHDMQICVDYAIENRNKIARLILIAYGIENFNPLDNNFHTIHNYIDEYGMVRKGAVSAKKGEKLLIPINMRDGCIIAIGKGNEDWNYSAPHGAGRVMSRTEAKKKLTMQDYSDEMKGIYSTSINGDTLDEAPMAYKPMQEIIDCIGDTVEIVKIIKPLYNFKASE